MVFIIEGFQNVGKTSLINELDYEKDRFSFNEYLDEFKLNTYGELNAFQIGKDLGILFGLNFLPKDRTIVLDRGPISTLFYSIKEERKLFKDNLIGNFFNEIKKFKNIHYIWINAINQNLTQKRNKNDGFDYLKDSFENDKYYFEALVNSLIQLKLNLHIFKNDFSKSIKENANALGQLIEVLNNEHK